MLAVPVGRGSIRPRMSFNLNNLRYRTAACHLHFALVRRFRRLTKSKGFMMLRVKMQDSVDILTFRLEGRLTGQGAEHVRALVTRSDPEMRLVIDLTEVMFTDGVGEEVLSLCKRLGAEFIAETSYSLHVCERLRLPLVRTNGSNTPPSGGSNGNGFSSRY